MYKKSFTNQASSVGGSLEELQLIGVQTGVTSLAKPSGDTDWSPDQEFGLAEFFEAPSWLLDPVRALSERPGECSPIQVEQAGDFCSWGSDQTPI